MATLSLSAMPASMAQSTARMRSSCIFPAHSPFAARRCRFPQHIPASSLTETGPDSRTQPRGAAIVAVKDGVAAIREPLRELGELVLTPTPGAAVDVQDHREWGGGTPWSPLCPVT